MLLNFVLTILIIIAVVMISSLYLSLSYYYYCHNRTMISCFIISLHVVLKEVSDHNVMKQALTWVYERPLHLYQWRTPRRHTHTASLWGVAGRSVQHPRRRVHLRQRGMASEVIKGPVGVGWHVKPLQHLQGRLLCFGLRGSALLWRRRSKHICSL